MFDVIDALEVLGADADFARAAPAQLGAMLLPAGLDPAVRSALIEGDVGALRALLRAPSSVCCLINPAEEEEEEGDEEQEEEGEEEDDDHQDDKS